MARKDILLRLSEDLVERIDEARGTDKRTPWIATALEEYLEYLSYLDRFDRISPGDRGPSRQYDAVLRMETGQPFPIDFMWVEPTEQNVPGNGTPGRPAGERELPCSPHETGMSTSEREGSDALISSEETVEQALGEADRDPVSPGRHVAKATPLAPAERFPDETTGGVGWPE